MPRRRAEPDLSALLATQFGLIRRDQALGVPADTPPAAPGLTEGALRWRLEKGLWQTVLPSVYAAQSGPLSGDQRAFAAYLYAGAAAQLTGPAALRLHGLRHAPADDRVHVLIPDHRRLSTAQFAAVSRTHRLDERASRVKGMAVVSPARAVADTLRLVGPDARPVLTESVQRGLATLDQLERELSEGPKRGSHLLRTALADLHQGVRAAPRTLLRDLCRTAPALPEVAWQPALTGPDGEPLPTPDGWIADTAIALDLVEAGDTPDDWAGRLRRHHRFQEYGVLVLTFTANEIRIDPGAVLGTIVRAYLERARAGVRHGVRTA
ncbi:hypothetical protein [Hamadaea tsunoensis]|uniref:hypothetical protein n=1 Tax=Hamadaea tsunoensis TaxID=53368 RepID=UPI0012FB5285|nr:hypothetical protein [Hamadaea tsunoensis]